MIIYYLNGVMGQSWDYESDRERFRWAASSSMFCLQLSLHLILFTLEANMLLPRPLPPAKPNPSTTTRHLQLPTLTIPHNRTNKLIGVNPISTPKSSHRLTLITGCTRDHNDIPISVTYGDHAAAPHEPPPVHQQTQGKNFWGAVSLIIGTAVGPGMLGLPAATIRSGPLPSTISILLSWVYVISSIILVAELSFAAMEEDGVAEVSFTGLATKTLGNRFGAFVALVYASLSFSLLVACVSGIGSIVSQWFPWLNTIIAHALFPFAFGTVICFFPFKVIDAANRGLCVLMLFSISALVGIGLSIARNSIMGSFSRASWGLSSVLPAIPVTVLTLGFHVITPFVCKIAGDTISEVRQAILIGGAVPLLMVLSWNLIVLGLAGTNPPTSGEPISLLLSVHSSALSAVQGFAFSALATSLIGYAVSFPKQLVDTIELIFGTTFSDQQSCSQPQVGCYQDGIGRVGFAIYSSACDLGNVGKVSFFGSRCNPRSESKMMSRGVNFNSLNILVIPLVLGVPVLLASFFHSTFSRALDFAGVYANCFLFGILPPVMTYIYQSRKISRYCQNSLV